MKIGREIRELARAIEALKEAARRVHRLSGALPAAERNAYLILRQIEMLEIEISDPVRALEEATPEDQE